MATIQDYLDLIKNAIYGKDVRQAIHDGIQQCYYDGKAGSTDLEARQRLDAVEDDINSLDNTVSAAENNITVLSARMDTFASLSEGSTTGDAELMDTRIAADGKVYPTAGDAVRAQVGAFGLKRINLFDKSNITDSRYINQETGALVFNGSFSSSDFINVSDLVGQTLISSKLFSGAFYKSDKTYLQSTGNIASWNTNDIPFVVPTGAVYLRICGYTNQLDVMQVGVGVSEYHYVPFDKYKLPNLSVDSEQVSGLSTAFIDVNLFDPVSITEDKYIDPNTGILRTLAGYNVSDYIEIGFGNYVCASECWDAVIYNEDKTYSRSIGNTYDDLPRVALLSGTEKYVRITVEDKNLSKAQVEINIGKSAYIPFGKAFNHEFDQNDVYKLTQVYVGASDHFQTINSALTAITDNAKNNRYVINVQNGTYNETITTKDYVDIVGENPYKCIIDYISDDESDWVNRSAIFASTYTTLKNLTVKTTGSKYPLHCDARYNEPYEVKAVNCIFKHDGFDGSDQPAGTAVGIGLYWGQHVSLENCECIASGVMGTASVYCHNSAETNAAKSRFRSLSIKDCILSNGTYGLRLQAIESNQLQANKCTYIGNKNTGNTPVSVEDNGYQSWHVLSIGNEPSYNPT